LESLDKLGLDPEKNAVCQFLQAIETDERLNSFKLFHSQKPIVLKDQYIPIQVDLELKPRQEMETSRKKESGVELKHTYAYKSAGKAESQDLVDPGIEKTILLKMEMVKAVREEVERLRANKETVNNVIFPLFSDFNKALKWEKQFEIDEAIKNLVYAYVYRGVGEASQEHEFQLKRVPWEQAKRQNLKLMVLADPGMGKTTLLKMEAVRTAKEERESVHCEFQHCDRSSSNAADRPLRWE
jgi:hypothetical protein